MTNTVKTNPDTVELLKECNAGIKMGVDSIEDVLDKVKSPRLATLLNDYKEKHQSLGSEAHALLNEQDESGKSPNAMARSMSFIKTEVMLAVNESDATIADLMTDGCNMGVKSLRRYLNKYKNADERVKELTEKLIDIEEDLAYEMKDYL